MVVVRRRQTRHAKARRAARAGAASNGRGKSGVRRPFEECNQKRRNVICRVVLGQRGRTRPAQPGMSRCRMNRVQTAARRTWGSSCPGATRVGQPDVAEKGSAKNIGMPLRATTEVHAGERRPAGRCVGGTALQCQAWKRSCGGKLSNRSGESESHGNWHGARRRWGNPRW